MENGLQGSVGVSSKGKIDASGRQIVSQGNPGGFWKVLPVHLVSCIKKSHVTGTPPTVDNI